MRVNAGKWPRARLFSTGNLMTTSARNKSYVRQVLTILRREYPEARCALDFRTPLELLIATILSAQCTDTRVNIVTKELFRKYRTASDYAEAPLEDLEKEIQSTGFYHNKAKNIRACCRILSQEYGGRVPRDLPTLVELPGIGRKTANVVLGTAYTIASGIVVDTHVARVAFRLGLTERKLPEKIEEDLAKLLPPKEWIAFSHQVIHHGRRVCAARRPKCSICPLGGLCPRIGVDAGDKGPLP
jgi:endonuclease-3